MPGRNTNKSIRKALGSIKDTTTISLAKVKSGYKELDVAIVKATNHIERPADEMYIQAIFVAISAGQPRADVAYCIHALSKRLTKTRNWAVALKTLIVIHRALREVDPTFQGKLINFGRNRSHILNMTHFKDDSSANAWNYSAWVRCYALFLEERLECYRILKYDVETEHPRPKDLDANELLELLPTLQQLLYRVIACQPVGATSQNYVIHLALSLVALDSMKIYNAISEGTVNLIDKFFEMKHHDAIRALDIYRRTGQQAERLADFYEACKQLDGCCGERFIKIEQRPASFLLAMEEYVRGIPRAFSTPEEQVKQVIDERKDTQKVVLAAIEDREVEVAMEDRSPSPPPAEPVKEEKAIAETFNLLDLDDPPPVENKALALTIVPFADQPTTSAPPTKLENRATAWEVALVPAAPNSNDPTSMPSKLAGGLNKLMLDCLCNNTFRSSSLPTSYISWDAASMSNPMTHPQQAHNPFFAFNSMAPATQSLQISNTTIQQQSFMLQQQQQQQQQQMMMMIQLQQNPQLMMLPLQKQPQLMIQQPQAMAQFANSFGANVYASGMPAQTYNPCSGLL